MTAYTRTELDCAQKSLASTIRKNEKVVKTLKSKENPRVSQINMVLQNIKYLRIMLTLIEKQILNDSIQSTVSKEELQEVYQVIPTFIQQIENVIIKFKEGTPQHTLAVRRINSYRIVLSLIQGMGIEL